MEAYSGGELGDEMLSMAWAYVSPAGVNAWPVDDAFSALDALRDMLVGANLPRTSERLLNTWECSRNLEGVMAWALTPSGQTKSLRYERMRTEWCRECGRPPSNMQCRARLHRARPPLG